MFNIHFLINDISYYLFLKIHLKLLHSMWEERLYIINQLRKKTKPTINQEYTITAQVVWKQMENQGT